MEIQECVELIMEVIPKSIRFFRTEMRECAQSELTVPQFRVLVKLSQNPGTNAEIAEWMGVSAPTMTRMIDQLAKRALVSRITQKNDRRQVKLALTKDGLKLHQRIQKDMKIRMTSKVNTLNQEKKIRLIKGLDILKELFSS